MGIHDREYYRSEDAGGIRLGGDWSVVGKLIAINAAVFIAGAFLERDKLLGWLAATPLSLAEPWWCWQLLTYGFAHGTIGHIFWNMFGLWVFGSAIEGVYGRSEFLRIYLVSLVLGGLVWAIRALLTVDPAVWPHYSVVGASGAVTAVTMLFCIHFPKQQLLLMMVLPVPAWFVGGAIIVGNLLGLANSDAMVAFDVHLVGAAFAICYYKFRWNLQRVLPRFTLGRVSLRRRLLRSRSPLRVHSPDEDFGTKDAEADELLAKVNRDGIESLTARERRVLEEYSRRMRQKHR